ADADAGRPNRLRFGGASSASSVGGRECPAASGGAPAMEPRAASTAQSPAAALATTRSSENVGDGGCLVRGGFDRIGIALASRISCLRLTGRLRFHLFSIRRSPRGTSTIEEKGHGPNNGKPDGRRGGHGSCRDRVADFVCQRDASRASFALSGCVRP